MITKRKLKCFLVLALIILIIFPNVFAFWAKANFHTHTLLSATNPFGSDGDSSVSVMAAKYKTTGYSVLSITDHQNANPYCTSTNNSASGFLCIQGEEWTGYGERNRHVLRINVTNHVTPDTFPQANLIDPCINSVKDQESISIIAHPNWNYGVWSTSELLTCADDTKIQPIIEICNGGISNTEGRYAVDRWVELLQLGKKVFAVGNDDAHFVNATGKCWTKISIPTLDTSSVITAMKGGNYYTSTGPSMDTNPFKIICDGTREIKMGETSTCNTISVSGTVTPEVNSTIKEIKLYKGGTNTPETSTALTCNYSGTSCNFSYTENVTTSGYYRLEVTDNFKLDNVNKKLWSNPIWINKNEVKGNIDGVTNGVLQGWVCDSSNYSAPLEVHLYVDGPYSSSPTSKGVFVDTTIANLAGETAIGTLCGGYTAHRFSFNLSSIANSKNFNYIHSYYVHAINNKDNPILNGSPVVYCGTACLQNLNCNQTTNNSLIPSSFTTKENCINQITNYYNSIIPSNNYFEDISKEERSTNETFYPNPTSNNYPTNINWATDNTNYFTSWNCTSPTGIKFIRKLGIAPINTRNNYFKTDSLFLSPDETSGGFPIVYFTEFVNTANATAKSVSPSMFSLKKAYYNSQYNKWFVADLLSKPNTSHGVSSQDGKKDNYIMNEYNSDTGVGEYFPGWGPTANKPCSETKIPGVVNQIPTSSDYYYQIKGYPLYGTGKYGLSTIILSTPSTPANLTTLSTQDGSCIHMNPTLFNYDSEGVPHSMLAYLFYGRVDNGCRLIDGTILNPGYHVYNYVNKDLGWQLDSSGLVENNIERLDQAFNNIPKTNKFLRADWTRVQIRIVDLSTKSSSPILDCSNYFSNNSKLGFGEPSGNEDFFIFIANPQNNLEAREIYLASKTDMQPKLNNAQNTLVTPNIVNLYRSILGREGSIQENLIWTNNLNAGNSLTSIRTAFAQSPEAINKIKSIYSEILQKTPTQAEIDLRKQELSSTKELKTIIAELIDQKCNSFSNTNTCTQNNWVPIDSVCQPTGTLIRTWSKTGDCINGTPQPPNETIPCIYVQKNPVCSQNPNTIYSRTQVDTFKNEWTQNQLSLNEIIKRIRIWKYCN